MIFVVISILLLVLALISWKWAAITIPFAIFHTIRMVRKGKEEVELEVNRKTEGSNGVARKKQRRRRGPLGRRVRIKVYKFPSK